VSVALLLGVLALIDYLLTGGNNVDHVSRLLRRAVS
jgi:hypothetical protein